MRTHDPGDIASCGTVELIVGGDWAIAHGNHASLALIARELAGRARPEERRQLEEVARRGADDPGTASMVWEQATARPRERWRTPGPRRDDPPRLRFPDTR